MKGQLSLLMACALIAITSGPAWSEPPCNTETETTSTATESGPAKQIAQATQCKPACQFSIEQVPKRLAGFVVGTVIGTPISLVRCTKRELVKQTKECFTLGAVPAPLGYISAAAFGIPSGILCGAWYGSTDGAIDGFVNSGNTVINRGTLSLDKLQF